MAWHMNTGNEGPVLDVYDTRCRDGGLNYWKGKQNINSQGCLPDKKTNFDTQDYINTPLILHSCEASSRTVPFTIIGRKKKPSSPEPF